MKTDLQIQNDVLLELGLERNVVAGTIGVEVHHGVVKLAGRVSDPATVQSAACAARRVDDVSDVVMNVDVMEAGGALRAVMI